MFKTKFTKITKLSKKQLERVKGGTDPVPPDGDVTNGIIIGDVTVFRN